VLEGIYIASASMEPTLSVGRHFFVNKLVYRFRPPRRGEMVVFSSPVEKKELVKRVIGVAGDDIRIEAKQVILNGSILVEPYVQHTRADEELVGDDLDVREGASRPRLPFGGQPGRIRRQPRLAGRAGRTSLFHSTVIAQRDARPAAMTSPADLKRLARRHRLVRWPWSAWPPSSQGRLAAHVRGRAFCYLRRTLAQGSIGGDLRSGERRVPRGPRSIARWGSRGVRLRPDYAAPGPGGSSFFSTFLGHLSAASRGVALVGLERLRNAIEAPSPA